MFKNILIATDGSKHARKAAQVAADLASTLKAELTIVSVSPLSLSVDDIERMPRSRRFPKPVKDEIKGLLKVMREATITSETLYPSVPAPYSALVALADVLIDEAETPAKRAKVRKIRRAPLTGNAPERILEQAKASKADLIVMGTRGLSDIGGLVMGSVSHKVIHLADCACMTVK